MRERLLVGPVVVHLPDLFVGAGDLDVVDLGFGDALAAAAEPEDDLVGEAVGDLPGGVFAGVFVVLLGEHLRILEVLRVEEEAVADDLAALDAEAAEDNHGGRRGCDRPLLNVDLSRRAWDGLRQQTLGDDVEDAGVRQVRVKGRVEGALESVGLRVGRRGFEVSDGYANVGDTAGGLGLECVLSVQNGGAGKQEEERRKIIKLSVPNGGLSLRTKHSV